ncbi:MAG: DUF445 domain-containing protein [Gemmatimonadetes bacterium]|jgi:uncharacterized membrane-anchored protein YjiN (DUF445 family)|nr:DUF445 domain-containing protein [Gemmatimonadota bacterium]MBP7550769.1 DUF445 domain-containing protein [Gemmatimonadaceae bacterium]
MTLPSGPVTPAAERPKGTLGPKPTDDARRADIARVRRYATTLLVVAAVVYVVAHLLERQWWWMGFVRATAEASLVGGLADWFAVTALFRQPLGLPIPHTAIVKRQKDRIARILGTFVQNHFLTREVIAQRLRALGLAQRIGEWLADPTNSARVAGQVTQGVATAVEKLPADKWQGGLVDEGVKLVARAVESSEDAIASTLREQIRASLPRLTPSIAIEAIHKRVMQALERFLAEVTSNPAHPARARVEAALREALDRLREAAEHPGETDGTPSAIAKLLTSVGTHLVADEAARAELEDRLTEMAASLVEEHGAEVASLIEHTVAGWDPDLAADRIELAVGRDLQYIRLNGTLVGGLAGLALYSLSLLF